MLTIDGACLEGGGQIVRSAVALAAISGTPVRVVNIRARRTPPGLAAQHVAAVNAVVLASAGECEGAVVGSREILFSPGRIRPAPVSIDVGTAGAVTLVLQAYLPVALRAGGSITCTGGTEVSRSPTIDYFDTVFARVLRQYGAGIATTIERRGYYPRGGGQVTVRVEPLPIAPLAIMPSEPEPPTIVSCSSNLPDHVTERQAAAAREILEPALGPAALVIDHRKGESTGTSVTVRCGLKGGSAVGKPGYRAERVGGDAARELLGEMNGEGVVDRHLADQLLIYLACYGGSYTATAMTRHAETMIALLDAFGYGVQVRGEGPVEFSA
jgi:RNA 3'-terminal phosphate cyclase (ATP)